MVNADDVDLLTEFTEAILPPCVMLLCHGVPVVLGIAPELPARGEVVGRYTRNGARRAVLVEVKELRVRPYVRAVPRDEDGHVAQNLDSLFLCVVVQAIPLRVEDVLLEPVEFDLIPLFFGEFFERGGIAAANLLRPLRPRGAVVFLLRRVKECVVVEPIRFLFAERAVVGVVLAVRAERSARLFEQIFLELLHSVKVDEGGIRLVRQEEVALCEPSTRDKRLGIDEHDVPGERRDGLIGRVSAADGTERENLPDLLSGFCKEVDEPVYLLSEVAHTVFRRERGRVQEDTRLALVAARFFALVQKQSVERRNFNAQPPALDLVGARGFETVLERAAGKVADVQLDRNALLGIAVERGDKYAVFLLMIEHIIAGADRACIGNDVTRAVERQDVARAQRVVLVADLNKPLHPAADLLVAVRPVVGAAVERVFEALHPNLVAVVNARHAGIGHLPQRRHEETARSKVELLGRHAHARLLDRGHPLIVRHAREHGDGALHIVTADEVHHRIEIFLRIVLDLTREPPCRQSAVRTPGEKVKEDRAQRIVHRRIHLIAREVFARRSVRDLVRRVLPHLADHNGVGVVLFQL